jgi:uridine phosphorylase
VLETNREYYVKAGVVGIEMELAALLVMAYMKGIRAGGIFTSDGNAAQDEKDKEWDPYRLEVDKGIEKSIEIGLNALHYLDGQPDMESKGNNQKIFK